MGKTTQKANELDVNITSRYVKYEDIINGIIPKDTLPIILIQVIVLIISFSPFPWNYIHSISRCAAEAAKQWMSIENEWTSGFRVDSRGQW